MSHPPKNLASNEIALFFETNQPLPAGQVGRLFEAIDHFAHDEGFLGSADILELRSVGTGTMWAIFAAVSEHGSNIAGMAGFGLALLLALKKPKGKVAERAAEIVVEHGVSRTMIITIEASETVLRDMMPLVKFLENREVARRPRLTLSGFEEDQLAAGSAGGTGAEESEPEDTDTAFESRIYRLGEIFIDEYGAEHQLSYVSADAPKIEGETNRSWRCYIDPYGPDRRMVAIIDPDKVLPNRNENPRFTVGVLGYPLVENGQVAAFRAVALN